jgi:hypothetical protein
MFSPMLAACPSFGPVWQDFLTNWNDDPVELPLYLALDALATHLFKSMSQMDLKTVEKIFGVIERWQLEGDTYVRTACTVGLFERVKHAKGPRDAFCREFANRLKPASRKAWNSA